MCQQRASVGVSKKLNTNMNAIFVPKDMDRQSHCCQRQTQPLIGAFRIQAQPICVILRRWLTFSPLEFCKYQYTQRDVVKAKRSQPPPTREHCCNPYLCCHIIAKTHVLSSCLPWNGVDCLPVEKGPGMRLTHIMRLLCTNPNHRRYFYHWYHFGYSHVQRTACIYLENLL